MNLLKSFEKRNAITVKRSRRSRCISENTKEDITATDTIGLTIGMANRFDNRWQKIIPVLNLAGQL
jgi:hypothetical protein